MQLAWARQSGKDRIWESASIPDPGIVSGWRVNPGAIRTEHRYGTPSNKQTGLGRLAVSPSGRWYVSIQNAGLQVPVQTPWPINLRRPTDIWDDPTTGPIDRNISSRLKQF